MINILLIAIVIFLLAYLLSPSFDTNPRICGRLVWQARKMSRPFSIFNHKDNARYYNTIAVGVAISEDNISLYYFSFFQLFIGVSWIN